ncbi:ATP-NAD kinase, partial [Fistulina hepatica ATCC 64428]
MDRDKTVVPDSRQRKVSTPLDSPCFLHSQLDKSASLEEWLETRKNVPDADVSVSKSLINGGYSYNVDGPALISGSDDGSDAANYGDSLTERLAETAHGVRELSKQLGRARIRSTIQNILIITKARDNRLVQLTRDLALYLMLKPRYGHHRGLVVYVDNQLRTSKRFDAAGIQHDHPELFMPYLGQRSLSSHSLDSVSQEDSPPATGKEDGQLRYWTSDLCSRSPHLFDFVVTLGGDGTVLFTSWLFQRIVPPVLSFSLGSLGFLTNFDFGEYKAVMDSALDSGIRVNLRMRFTCTVYRAVHKDKGKPRRAVKKADTGEIMLKDLERGGWEALEGVCMQEQTGKPPAKDKEIMCFMTRAEETFEVLNDLVVDRGPSPYVSLLELFGDDHHMTTVQADGLILATPTGSTAYSLSAGGALVHPEIPALLITPICPHTLSFRPMLLPDSMELRICVPYNSRSTAWASFDGRGRVELRQGDHIKITASRYPFPTVCADKQFTDWFSSISRTLKWNERERQKSFVMVEEEQPKYKRGSQRGSQLSTDSSSESEQNEEDEDDDEPEFDITDSS